MSEPTNAEPPASGRSRSQSPRARVRPWRMGAGTWTSVAVALAFLWAAASLDLSAGSLLRMPAEIVRIVRSFFPIDLGYARANVVQAILESIQIAWLGTLVGALLSLPLGLIGAGNLFPRTSLLIKPVLAAVRAFPEILLALYFVPIVGLGAFAGTLAIGIHSVGTLGKLTADVVESMDLRPVEAVVASGGGSPAVLRIAVLPQVLPEVVALWLFRFEINLRASAVLGVVGAGGIGGLLLNTLRYREFGQAGAVVLATVGVVLAIDTVSARIRGRLVRE